MGDSSTPELSSEGSEMKSQSWSANSMDWDYESDETDPKTIFSGPKGSTNVMGVAERNKENTIKDDESVIRNVTRIEDQEDAPEAEVESPGKMFYGGIWWNSSWIKDMDLYDDNENWRCGDDSIMEENPEEDPEEEEDPVEEEDPEEKDPEEDPEEEDPEEDPEEGVNKGETSTGDSMDKSFSDSNITP